MRILLTSESVSSGGSEEGNKCRVIVVDVGFITHFTCGASESVVWESKAAWNAASDKSKRLRVGLSAISLNAIFLAMSFVNASDEASRVTKRVGP